MNFSDRWADRERRLENDEPTRDTYGDGKQKVNVETEEEEEKDEPVFSGLFCVFCHGYAVHIYEGMSVCHECFTKEVGDLIKKNRK